MQKIKVVSITLGLFCINNLAIANTTIQFGNGVQRLQIGSAAIATLPNQVFNLRCHIRDRITKGSLYLIINNDPRYQVTLTPSLPTSFEVKNVKAVSMGSGMTGVGFKGQGSLDFSTVDSRTGSKYNYTYFSCEGESV